MQSVLTQAPSVTLSWLAETQTADIQNTTPHEEAVDAFLLTFRSFIMANEDISFRKMPEVYERLPISKDSKQQLRLARDNFNNWLDSETNPAYNIFDVILTNRRVMNTFINGGLGHANNPDAVKEYRNWELSPAFPFLEVQFISILATIFKTIWYFHSLHEAILQELEPTTESGQ